MLECNQKELSMILGISDRRVRQLMEDGLFQRISSSRKYSLPKCVQEYLQYKIESETATSNTANYEREHAEHERVKKEIAKLRLRRIRGELHEAGDVEAVISDMLIRFRGKILAIPTKLAPQMLGLTDANEAVDILKGELREALSELAEYDPGDYSTDVVEDEEEEDMEPDSESV